MLGTCLLEESSHTANGVRSRGAWRDMRQRLMFRHFGQLRGGRLVGEEQLEVLIAATRAISALRSWQQNLEGSFATVSQLTFAKRIW